MHYLWAFGKNQTGCRRFKYDERFNDSVKEIKIKDLMRLTQGSVVELDRIAGEPLDLLVNDTVVAQGEVVLVNDRYGIRLTRVVPSTDRLKSL